MRITIETTNSDPEYSQKVIIEDPTDDKTVDDMVEMFKQALLGCGYSPENIKDISYEGN